MKKRHKTRTNIISKHRARSSIVLPVAFFLAEKKKGQTETIIPYTNTRIQVKVAKQK